MRGLRGPPAWPIPPSRQPLCSPTHRGRLVVPEMEHRTRDELLREIDRWLLVASDGENEAAIRQIASEAIVLKQNRRMKASDTGDHP